MSDEKRETPRQRHLRTLAEQNARSGELIGDEPETQQFEPVESNEPEAAPAVDEPEDENAEARKRLLASIPEELRDRFPPSRLDQIIAEAKAKALEEKEKALLRDLRGQANLHARASLDLIPQSDLLDEEAAARMNQEVWVTINCPGGGAGAGDIGYRISGLLYRHGSRYKVKRHVANQLAKMDYDAWYHEVLFRTLDQHKPGNSAADVMGQAGPHTRIEEVLH